jgi:Rap1a immunity proteins
MRNLCGLLVVLVACLPAVPEQTTDMVWHSGNEFLAICAVAADKTLEERTPEEFRSSSDCIPYVRGMDDALSLADTNYCAPNELTNGQKVRILVKYIRDNPTKAHQPTVVLYAKAMDTAFPCRKKGAK